MHMLTLVVVNQWATSRVGSSLSDRRSHNIATAKEQEEDRTTMEVEVDVEQGRRHSSSEASILKSSIDENK